MKAAFEEKGTRESIAIVGVSCRMPGGISELRALWSALEAGRDLVTEVPPDRFDADRFTDPNRDRPGRSYTCAGGFLEDIAGFDAEFFGIAPREASRLDPQQRLILELAVEAFDDAGIDDGTLAGSDTAVFVGASYEDYGALQMNGAETLDAYSISGWTMSNIANRVSYALDLHGPSITIATACSSSLVALHEACRSLWAGETAIAMVGGVNVMLNPCGFVAMAKAAMLSPSGRCRTFSAAADGFVRSEGGGALVLKRLSDALANADRIHAVVLGTGANSNGRTPGIKQPSLRGQEALLRTVLARAGVHPEELVYFEAHGTGTALGDPIECGAIGHVLGCARIRPLPIGSIKTNLGHLEPAAGIAGVLKAILVLRHGVIPASLHGTPRNPAIDFAALNLEPVERAVTIEPVQEHPRAVVGVNSFGFGGANAHTLLAAPPADRAPEIALPAVFPMLLSGRCEAASKDAARRMIERLDGVSAQQLFDICWTACRRRNLHPYRCAVIGANVTELADRLLAVATGQPMAGTASARAVPHGRIAFAFSGNGSQWARMGADLLDADPIFRAELEAVDRRLSAMLGWSVLEELRAPPERSRMARTEVAQPCLFALQVGLVEVLRGHGIRPAAVFGHSVGEVAAAYTAGALDLDAAATVIAVRSSAQARTSGSGRMAAVGLSHSDARTAITPYGERLELAAINSEHDVTIAGDAEALREIGAELSARGVFCRELDLDYAFHSRAMLPLEREITTGLHGLRAKKVHTPCISTVTGEPVRGDELNADYWWHNVRDPVLFAAAVEHLLAQAFDVLVEVGPQPVLSSYLRRLASNHAETLVVPTLARSTVAHEAIASAVASILASGAPIDWVPYFPIPGRVVDLPAYPWQRTRHWHGDPELWERRQHGKSEHPLLGERAAVLEPTWCGLLDVSRLPWLREHRIGEAIVFPATAFVEMGLAAGRNALGAAVEIRDLVIPHALVLSEGTEVFLQVALSDEDGAMRIASRTDTAQEWKVHAQGRVRRALRSAPPPVDLDAIRARLHSPEAGAVHYDRAATRFGLRYGPTFRTLRELCSGADEVLARYVHEGPQTEFEVHPALLDGALQSALPLMPWTDTRHTTVVLSIGAVRLWQRPTSMGFAHARLRTRAARQIHVDVLVTDESGTVTIEVTGCRLGRLDAGSAESPTPFTYVMRAAPRADVPAGPSPLPLPHDLAAGCSVRLAALNGEWHTTAKAHATFVARTKELAAQFAARTFAQLVEDRAFAPHDLVLAGVDRKHLRVIDALLALAYRHGWIEHTSETHWKVTRQAAPEALFASMVADHPEHAAMLVLLGRCGRHLPDILCGRCDPLEIILGSNSRIAEQSYEASPWSLRCNRLTREWVRAIVGHWPADRPLRILEIGAGTGGTTTLLLPELSPACTQYVFTDVSEAFLTRAGMRFSEYDFVDYRLLDLERDPMAQGFAEGTFDLVIAANVVHATTNLRATLERVAQLLADGGHLLLTELSDPDFPLLCFGLLDGWWSFADRPLRTRSPLLDAVQWPTVLRECRFSSVIRLDDDAPEEAVGHCFVAARAPRTTTQSRMLEVHDTTQWIVAAEDSRANELALATSEALVAAGASAVRTIGVTKDTPWSELLAGAMSTVGVVLILSDPGMARDAHATTELTVRRLEALGAIAKACQLLSSEISPMLWLVTAPSGALPAPQLPLAPADAAVWGATRTMAQEHPRLAVRRLSLERGDRASTDGTRLAQELVAPSAEDEIVLTRAGRFVPRLVPWKVPTRQVLASATDGYALDLREQGPSYRLAWVPAALPIPGPDEVVIGVRTMGLNYRDVLRALGRLTESESANAPVWYFDCAGIVTAVGSAVTTCQPGDRVFGVVVGAGLQSHGLAKASLVQPMMDFTGFDAAATIPTPFITVHYSLERLARLAEGDTLLVHAGAGGVGLAAIQHARSVGARVIATAGSDEKRDLLRLLGVADVVSSRSLAFADEILAMTDGKGVDVVLNSLAGEAIPRGLELLRPGGRFIELGKRDFHLDSPLRMRALRNNVSFFGVDADELYRRAPDRIAEELAAVTRLLRTGEYRPLLHRVYPASRIAEGFALMQHSRHIGKVVISFDEHVPLEQRCATPKFDNDAAYLVTGGTRGFGAASARWLVERGARHVALVSRSGHADTEVNATLEALAERGATATVYAADVTDEAAMRTVVAAVEATGHRLRGVIHAAMVVDDAPLTELTAKRLEAVIAPKISGALILDALTRDHPLDLFVMCSSIASVFGNMGQANYVAGNMFLEALARARSRAGWRTLAVALGAISDTGYVSRHGLASGFAGRGTYAMTAEQALRVMDELLGGEADMAMVGRFDWGLALASTGLADVPRMAYVRPARLEQDAPADVDLLTALAKATPDEAKPLIENAVAAIVANVLRVAPDQLERSRSFEQLGIDSLMSNELRAAIVRRFGCEISTIHITGSAGIGALTRHLCTVMRVRH
ncbi:SDR family NAD(P)-dependent oxidoreductase [Pendulispora brunnea]|uniref:SDR family NAD(P)-dependent oxidoreductase n=1 Tax=Pendulispora brunnea TaxID=2905690 RepID=A0ABZ2JYA3_9BACT